MTRWAYNPAASRMVKTKDTSFDVSLIVTLLVRQVDYRWNQIYASLMLMYEKLDRFGFAYCFEGLQ